MKKAFPDIRSAQASLPVRHLLEYNLEDSQVYAACQRSVCCALYSTRLDFAESYNQCTFFSRFAEKAAADELSDSAPSSGRSVPEAEVDCTVGDNWASGQSCPLIG